MLSFYIVAHSLNYKFCIYKTITNIVRGSHGHDRMVAGFTNTYAISAYHH